MSKLWVILLNIIFIGILGAWYKSIPSKQSSLPVFRLCVQLQEASRSRKIKAITDLSSQLKNQTHVTTVNSNIYQTIDRLPRSKDPELSQLYTQLTQLIEQQINDLHKDQITHNQHLSEHLKLGYWILSGAISIDLVVFIFFFYKVQQVKNKLTQTTLDLDTVQSVLTNLSNTNAQNLQVVFQHHREKSRLSAQYLRLQEKTTYDDLTGLYTKTSGIECIKKLVYSYGASNFIWIAVFDLDQFKRVNDTYGHLTGNEVLKLFGKCIRKNIRKNDDVALRWGGEEIVLACPNIEYGIFKNILLRIQGDVLKTQVVDSQTQKVLSSELCPSSSFTFSCGFAELSEAKTFSELKQKLEDTAPEKREVDQDLDALIDKTIECVFKLADKRMYQAKNTGRNKIISPGETLVNKINQNYNNQLKTTR